MMIILLNHARIFKMANQTLDVVRGFPIELLKASDEARLKYFKAKHIGHAILKQARDELLSAIKYSNQFEKNRALILVYGPTGAGKSTLAESIVDILRKEALLQMQQDPAFIPAVQVGLFATQDALFDWGRNLEDICKALLEPGIAYKIDNSQYISEARKALNKVTDPRKSKLLRSLENALIHRHPLAFILDDAQYTKKVASGRRLEDVMDFFKSLVDFTNTTIVLIGTYELLDFTELSGQLGRRSIKIHLSRYTWDKRTERDGFKNALGSFRDVLPFLETPDFDDYEYFYDRCAGCIGVLKEWLCRAQYVAIKEGAKTLKKKHLDKTVMPTGDLLRIANEISAGETRLQQPTIDAVHNILRTPTPTAAPTPTNTSQNTQRRTPRPGTRLPGSDPVGLRGGEAT